MSGDDDALHRALETKGSTWGTSKEDVLRKIRITGLLREYAHTGSREALAQLTEIDPPGGDAGVGKAIAVALREKRPDKKLELYGRNRAMTMDFRLLRRSGMSAEKAREMIANEYLGENGDSETVRKTLQRLRKNIKKQK